MTDDSTLDDDVQDTGAPEGDLQEDGAFDDAGLDVDPAAVLAEAKLERLHRQAYWHQQSKQLFSFLFANCMFFAAGLAAWTRSGYNEDGTIIPVDPSLLFTGLDTIRGSVIFALSIYGFWTAVFNIWQGQMKVWPYLLAGIVALWVGIGGIVSGIGGEQWERSKIYLKDHAGSKTLMDDLFTPLGTIAPGFWLCAFGGLIVLWVIVSGLLKGQQTAKAAATTGAPASGRRRR
ncbi:MAG: hypothetical protein O2894_08630 [Planctomycetota bacterium]|nr:hypothetical protein [Planctomycetota bacterium]